jgi:tetratricopeptide (TPR) repeat protein
VRRLPFLFLPFLILPVHAQSVVRKPAAIIIDYPAEGSVFPPDFAPPTFLFRDSGAGVAWRVDIEFHDGAAPLRMPVAGEPMRVGEIDERCLAETNEPPKLTRQQESTRTWTPDTATWAAIKKRSVQHPTTLTFSGFAQPVLDQPVSQGQVTLRTSVDPVDAPIFFRDVPLMPSQVEKGVIKPLPKNALPLVAWRLRYVGENKSRLLMDNLPTCANCHSFSRDGKTLGLDMDGPANDKGLYALVPIARETTISNQEIVAWSSFKGKLGSKIRVGFMSQVSPDGQYVVTMVSPSDLGLGLPGAAVRKGAPQLPLDVQGNFYVANFKDYRFLQVFYPTRGVLAWYSKATGKLQPLPGADDPRYVHTNATWSPDGKYLVFARAEARTPYPEGGKLAETANDPNETQMQYDLYRIPFNEGRGGMPEPVRGASRNGMSNSFPKISPDGRWIVFVQARNGLLMRPDGQLYVVPADGGQARRLRSNTPLMNSWHSFSPNGRWLVFSSKSRSPYTQMFLTHIDEQGNDTPAILIENATAANRAVNIPEFVNLGQTEWARIDAPATEFYRVSDAALELLQKGRYDEAIAEFRRALDMDAADTTALNNLGAALTSAGQLEEAVSYLKKAIEIDPGNFKSHTNLGVALARAGRFDAAAAPLERAVQLNPEDARAQSAYGGVLVNQGRVEDAMRHLEKALEINPADADAHNNLGGILARTGKFDDAIPHFEKALSLEPNSAVLLFNLGRAYAAVGRFDQGVRNLERAAELSHGQEPAILEKLADGYAETGRLLDAIVTARRALDTAARLDNRQMVDTLRARIAAYESRMSK